MNNRALGKGLSALIPEKVETEKSETARFVKTQLVKDSALQPRMDYNDEKLAELVNSIKEKGVLQPILVREKDDGYEVIAGERRLRAARKLSLDEIPVIIKSVTDQEALVLGLIENIQREDLNPIEAALAFQRLADDFQLSHEQIAQSIGKDRTTVTNFLRLLRLPDYIQQSVVEGKLSYGQARTMVSVENPEELKQIFAYTLDKGLSVRELETLVRTGFKNFKIRKARPAAPNPDLAYLEEDLQKTLGTKVRILSKKKRGKIVIEFYSPEDLDRIVSIIKS